jgi:hypothetical protein
MKVIVNLNGRDKAGDFKAILGWLGRLIFVILLRSDRVPQLKVYLSSIRLRS